MNRKLPLAAAALSICALTASSGAAASSGGEPGLTGASHASRAQAAPAEDWYPGWIRTPSPLFGALAGELTEQTLRAVTRVTGPGTQVRVRLSNLYGKSPNEQGNPPLVVNAAAVGLRDEGPEIAAGTNTPLTFAGEPSVTVLPGETVESDPVALVVEAQDDVAVSLYVPAANPPNSNDFVTHYATPPGSGDHALDEGGEAFTEAITTGVPIVTGVDVLTDRLRGAIVTIGGSVTAGSGSTQDGYDTFPDVLGQRVHGELPPAQQRSVVNAGIGGTTAASSCSVDPVFGPSAQERLQRDVLSLSNVTHVVVYAGTNDLSFGCTAEQIIASYKDIAEQAATVGAKTLVTTVTPRESYSEEQNAHREAVNAWTRAGGNCSGFCHAAPDFDAAVRDPRQPNRINPVWDSGDGIHPNGVGYTRLAESIDLCGLLSDDADAAARDACINVRRVAGASRFDTAVAASREVFPAAEAVVIARADAYADALTAAPLAFQINGPLLLSDSAGLPEQVRAEVERLGATTAYLLGGEAALTPQVEADLRAAGVETVERIAGTNRFATAAAVAERVGGTAVYLAKGIDADPSKGFADALSVAPVAALQGRPILLTATDTLPEATATALGELGVTDVTVLGGTAAVSTAVEEAVRGSVATTSRVKGSDRYATAVAIARLGLDAGLSVQRLWVATGRDFADALAAGPAVAADAGLLVLLDGQDAQASRASWEFLGEHRVTVRLTRVIGGSSAVTPAAAEQVSGLLRAGSSQP